jgi:outer membrane protein insertion porin family
MFINYSMKVKVVSILGLLVLTSSCHHRIPQNVSAGLSEGAVIDNVMIANNNRIQTETIKSILQTKTGDHLRTVVIRADIQKLYSMGYFDEVRVSEEASTNGGKTVIFYVREKP